MKKPIIRKFSDIEIKPVNWLWEGQIARGKLTIITGEPGLGKSQITAFIASVVSKGGKWPVDGGPAPKGSVVMINAEDDPADTIRPRLEALEANLNQIQIFDGIEDQEQTTSFKLDEHLDVLQQILEEAGDVILLIIDPITAYLGRTDSYKDAELRSLIEPLVKIAEKYNVAVLAVAHPNKSEDKKAIHRVSGSIAFTAAPRAVFMVIKDKDDPDRRLMLPIKNNLAPDRVGFAFNLENVELGQGIKTTKVVWEDEYNYTSVDQAISNNKPTGKKTKTDKAEEFLLEKLKDGAVTVTDLEKDADDVGIGKRPLRDASERLNINKKRIGFGAGSHTTWELPIDDHTRHDTPSQNKDIYEEKRHLWDQSTDDAEKTRIGLLLNNAPVPNTTYV